MRRGSRGRRAGGGLKYVCTNSWLGTERKTERKTKRNTERKTDRKTEIKSDKKTDRETNNNKFSAKSWLGGGGDNNNTEHVLRK